MGDKIMAQDKGQNLQEIFLNSIRKDHAAVTVFLVNGVKLQGIVTWFDNFSLLLKRDQHVQLVYKHAISTIMPTNPISLQEDEDSME
jgi:host factor-I protein